MSSSSRVVVVIASVGRPVELARWIGHVHAQTLRPIEMIWSIVSDADLPEQALPDSEVPFSIVRAPKGLPRQRNAALAAVHAGADIVAFFDDDYVPSRTCIEGVASSFAALPHVVGLSGHLLADGINSSGIGYDVAREMVDRHDLEAKAIDAPSFRPLSGLYGCNMAFRLDALGDVRFDERLPLYGWQEDVDFSARMARGRPIGQTDGFAGVHQGVKGARTSGRRLGYSQIANVLYLRRKGSIKTRRAIEMMTGNFIANHLKTLHPEPWVDRWGRVVGNWLAIRDALLGSVKPEHILKI